MSLNFQHTVQILTTNSMLKIQEGFKSVIQILTGSGHFTDPANSLVQENKKITNFLEKKWVRSLKPY